MAIEDAMVCMVMADPAVVAVDPTPQITKVSMICLFPESPKKTNLQILQCPSGEGHITTEKYLSMSL